MSEIIFSAKNVTKQYKVKYKSYKLKALDHFNMEIRRGEIYGFVGRNGAGKTTLMRILTGRARQTSGEIKLFGQSDEEGMCALRKNIGAIIEQPALYLGMTAYDNLKAVSLQKGTSDYDKIDDILELVGLADEKWKKAKDFSLGMKQRLALGIALMGEPEFLVLDEPINGLDPEGIVEFRQLIKKLNIERNVTVLISSHLLGELDQLATCYGFIKSGKMIEEISAATLHERIKGMQNETSGLEGYYMSLIKGAK